MASREPCPDRIFDDIGGAFSMGCVGGSLFYFAKGFYNSPSRERFLGALRAVKNRGPLLGGSFAMWGALFSTFDCFLLWYRQKESPFNAVLAGTLTGGALAIRSGFKIAWRNAVAGGVILAIIEGVGASYAKISMREQMLMMQEFHKLQEEQMNRRSQGLPDLTREEIEQIIESKQRNKPGFFSGLTKK